jgi:hypothetical protein
MALHASESGTIKCVPTVSIFAPLIILVGSLCTLVWRRQRTRRIFDSCSPLSRRLSCRTRWRIQGSYDHGGDSVFLFILSWYCIGACVTSVGLSAMLTQSPVSPAFCTTIHTPLHHYHLSTLLAFALDHDDTMKWRFVSTLYYITPYAY